MDLRSTVRFAGFRAVLALGFAVGFASLAFAQNSQYPPQNPPQTSPAPGPGSRNPEQAKARVEEQINRLHQQLGITADQEPQWNAFAAVMRANAEHMEGLYRERASRFNQMNAVESLRSYQRIVQAHAEDLARLVPAFETLYASLTPDQQRIADQVFRYQNRRRGSRTAPHG